MAAGAERGVFNGRGACVLEDESSRDGEGDGWLQDSVNVPSASALSANTTVNVVIVTLRVLDSV